jgi:hypothetical protein
MKPWWEAEAWLNRVVVLIPQFVHDDPAGSRMQSMRYPNHFKDGNSENPWPGLIKMPLNGENH